MRFESGFTKKVGRDIPHISFLQLVILAAVAIDADMLEGVDDVRDLEAHGAKTIYEIFVVASVPVHMLDSCA